MNILKLIFIIIAAFVLNGCSSTGDIKQKQPSISESSAKETKKLYLCINQKWVNLDPSVKSYETEKGFEIYKHNEWNTYIFMLAEITSDNDKTAVKMYNNPFIGSSAPYKTAIYECLR